MTYQHVIDAIQSTTANERKAIAHNLRIIDFKNGDIKHYLRHLAQAIAL